MSKPTKCRYCGAGVALDSDDLIQFACDSEIHDFGTPDERFYGSLDCADAFRERFDKLFPVPPWDDAEDAG